MPVMRFVSSSTNALYASPARNTDSQPYFASDSFHDGESVAVLTAAMSASRCAVVMPGRAEDAAPVAEHDVDALLLERRDAVPGLAGDETASARMRPLLMCSANSPRPAMPAVTWPPTMLATWSPPPLAAM